jgi:hypothetical protein
VSDGPRDSGPVDGPADGPTDGPADTPPAVEPPDLEPPDVETLTAPVERRIIAVGSKSEREATVAIIDDRPLVLRHRGGGAYDDPADLAALAGRTARLTGTRLSTVFLVDEAVAL